MYLGKKISVIIPSYKVKAHLISVVDGIPEFIDLIIVVDDKCPEESGNDLLSKHKSEKLTVLFHENNQGVGGAMITGYVHALKEGMDIAVKMDGDGQMDPQLLPSFLEPICNDRVHYTKGNRFYWPRTLRAMPFLRVIGNSGLSFINKVSSGYWNIMDPTNGFTALDLRIFDRLDSHLLSKRFFFESDMLFRLYLIRAVVEDVPMISYYGEEISNLKLSNSLIEFSVQHFKRTVKRIIYMYFIRDFNPGTFYLITSLFLLLFSGILGGIKWYQSFSTGIATPLGTLLIVALPMLVGFQLFLSFLAYDTQNIPKK